MNSKIINLNNRIKQNVLINSKRIFHQAMESKVRLGFGIQEFKGFNNNLYQLYQEKQKINKYEDDMNLFITYALLKKINSTDKVLKLEDILDSIWDITVRKDEVDKKIKKI